MNSLVTYIKCKFNVFALMIESHLLLHANSVDFFLKTKGTCFVLSFKREHKVFLFTCSG